MAEEKKRKKKDEELSPVNDRGAEISEDELLEDEGEELEDEEAIAEQLTPEEETTSPEVAEEVAEEGAGLNVLTLTTTDVPEAEGLEVGDPININAELTLKRKDTEAGTFEFELTDVTSPNQEAGLEEQADQAAAGQAPPPLPNLLG